MWYLWKIYIVFFLEVNGDRRGRGWDGFDLLRRVRNIRIDLDGEWEVLKGGRSYGRKDVFSIYSCVCVCVCVCVRVFGCVRVCGCIRGGMCLVEWGGRLWIIIKIRK